ncbi:hypothetical protein [Dongia sp. agr-C8]
MTCISRWIVSILLVLSLAACAASDGAGTNTGGAGSSLESAIVIEAKNEIEGVRAEYRWIRDHMPGWRSGNQHLLNENGRVYDMIEVSRGGETREVYFDITGWFGKWE